MDSSKYIFSADRRPQLIKELKSRQFDLLVIGGGITGAGIALDAATRGLSVALIEKNDFASGTSSRSTKLIHGGLRYLKNMEFRLVRDVGKERAIVYQNAPHLVVPEKMLLPLVEGGSYGKFATRFGLWLYDWLAGVRKSEKRVMLNRAETLAKEPLLQANGLKGSGYYSEYRTDDARLTLEVMKTAAAHGALCMNYVECVDLELQPDGIDQVVCLDRIGDGNLTINARKVVNAAGPWADKLREKDGAVKGKRLFLTKGIHIVVPQMRLPVNQSVYFDVGDGRMIFTIPRFGTTYIGTTDTAYTGNFEEPDITISDVNYLLDAVNRTFPSVNLEMADIISSWSGLRPLIHEDGKSPSEMSRKDEVFQSEQGLITIAGGKLTGYRLMAKKVVDLVCSQLDIQQECKSDQTQLVGGEFKHADMVDSYIKSLRTRLKGHGLKWEEAELLVRTFGKQADHILDKTREFQGDTLIQALAWYCLRYEQVSTLADFYVRRTGYLYFMPHRITASLDAVVPLFVEFLGWDEKRVTSERDHMETLLVTITNFTDDATT